MTTRYRVEYALKTHRRDQFIEWIKGLLAVPFVLHSQPTSTSEGQSETMKKMAENAARRYAEIFHDVELLLEDHISHQNQQLPGLSKLKHLIPSIGDFFTPLALEKAFAYQDERRRISSRRFVPPSFNDCRLILNTAQIMTLSTQRSLRLITFDGDVTLYEDGGSLTHDNPVLKRMLAFIRQGYRIGIVTAAGYTNSLDYYKRIPALLDAIRKEHCESEESPVIVVGGEANYLLRYNSSAPGLLEMLPREDWLLPEMREWSNDDIRTLLDVAEQTLKACVDRMDLPASIIRKERAVGIIPTPGLVGHKFTREQLEETVLVLQQVLESSQAGRRIPFCAFNGGNDVFVDIGDKSWGVKACQRYWGGLLPHETLHCGDQFLSSLSNDFKARSACTTAWIASPAETVALLDEMIEHMDFV